MDMEETARATLIEHIYNYNVQSNTTEKNSNTFKVHVMIFNDMELRCCDDI